MHVSALVNDLIDRLFSSREVPAPPAPTISNLLVLRVKPVVTMPWPRWMRGRRTVFVDGLAAVPESPAGFAPSCYTAETPALPLERIVRIDASADRGLSEIDAVDVREHVTVTMPLDEIASLLAPLGFVRVNSETVVNLRHTDRLIRRIPHGWWLTLTHGLVTYACNARSSGKVTVPDRRVALIRHILELRGPTVRYPKRIGDLRLYPVRRGPDAPFAYALDPTYPTDAADAKRNGVIPVGRARPLAASPIPVS